MYINEIYKINFYIVFSASKLRRNDATMRFYQMLEFFLYVKSVSGLN